MMMENIHHGPLESGIDVFESKGNDTVGNGAPWGSKHNFFIDMIDIFGFDYS
jgi:hypothetical protein